MLRIWLEQNGSGLSVAGKKAGAFSLILKNGPVEGTRLMSGRIGEGTGKQAICNVQMH